MKLAIIVPTFNRQKLFEKALQSLLRAELPERLKVEVLVIDNNSTDNTKNVFEKYKPDFRKKRISLTYIFESNQGKSFAVNRGINSSQSDLISILDDDMEIAGDWFVQIRDFFEKRWAEIDFIAGKVLPIWEVEPTKIIPAMQSSIAIGDHGESEWEFNANTPILSGGHSVLKRQVFEEIGLYPTELGPKGGNFLGCEDDIFYQKILEAKKKGIYLSKLKFYHFVPQHRLEKSYFRKWCFGVGKSWSLMDIHYHYFQGAKLFSLPRYMYRELLISLKEKIKALVLHNEDKSFEAEKSILVFFGFFYAKNIENRTLDNSLKKLFGGLNQTKR